MPCRVRAVLLLFAVLAASGCAPHTTTPTFTSATSTVPAPSAVVDGQLATVLRTIGRPVVVERILDGDTLTVTGDERIRLLTIDAPELRAHTKADDADCGAQAAADELAALLPPGTAVLLNGLKGEPATDRYGRTLSDVFVERPEGLVNVSLRLVETGAARVFVDYPTSETPDAEQLQAAARAAGRGQWGACPA